MSKLKSYSTLQLTMLVALRISIGWHFLYEGLYKYFKAGWTAKHYLNDSTGVMEDFFLDMANNPTLLVAVDFVNIWGLTLIGAGLIVGCLSRYAAIGGVVMLCLFYLSHIPYIDCLYMMPLEGNYLWFDKNVVEICGLLVLIVFPTSHIIGIDRFLCTLKNKKAEQ